MEDEWDQLAASYGVKLPPPPSAPKRASSGWWTPEREDQAVNHLQTHAKLSPIGARGLVARWKAVEAGAGPSAINPSSGAVGIGQWLGSRKNGVPSDFEGQLNHAVKELNSTESAAAKRLRLAQTPEDAAIGASMYERAEGYNPKTGRDNFVNHTIKAIGDYQPTPQIDFDTLSKDYLGTDFDTLSQDYGVAPQPLAQQPTSSVDLAGQPTSSGKPFLQPALAGVDPSQMFGGQARVDIPQLAPPSTEIQPEGPTAVGILKELPDAALHQALNPSGRLANKRPLVKTGKPPALDAPNDGTYKGVLGNSDIKVGYGSEPKVLPGEDYNEYDDQGNVIPPARSTSQVPGNAAQNAVAESIPIPAGMDKDAASEHIRKQLSAKYGGNYDGFTFLSDFKPGHSYDVTYGDLMNAGVDINPLIRQKVVENRVGNPQPDLRSVPYDFATDDANTLNESKVFSKLNPPLAESAKLAGWDIDKLAAGGVGGIVQNVGDLSGVLAGLMKASPVYGAVNEIVSNGGSRPVRARDTTADELLKFYHNAAAFTEATGEKVDGKDTIPTMLVKGAGNAPEYALMSALPGGLMTGIAIKRAALARAEDKPWSEVVKQLGWGAGEGALFHFLPKGVQKTFGTDTSALKQIGRIGTEVAGVSGGIYGLQTAEDKIEGRETNPEDKLKGAITIGLFHLYGATKGAIKGRVARVVDPNSGIEAYVKVEGPDKAVFVEKQKPDFEMAVPEFRSTEGKKGGITPPETTTDLQSQTIKTKSEPTVDKFAETERRSPERLAQSAEESYKENVKRDAERQEAERVLANTTVKTLHNLAQDKGLDVESPEFHEATKGLTGKDKLDDLEPEELVKVGEAIEKGDFVEQPDVPGAVEGDTSRGVAKEPWEMTRDEYADGIKSMQVGAGVEKFYHESNTNPVKNGGLYINREGAIAGHELDVESALRKGKPVPPEVLKDYPDLKTDKSPELSPQIARDVSPKEESKPTSKPSPTRLRAQQGAKDLLKGSGSELKTATSKELVEGDTSQASAPSPGGEKGAVATFNEQLRTKEGIDEIFNGIDINKNSTDYAYVSNQKAKLGRLLDIVTDPKERQQLERRGRVLDTNFKVAVKKYSAGLNAEKKAEKQGLAGWRKEASKASDDELLKWSKSLKEQPYTYFTQQRIRVIDGELGKRGLEIPKTDSPTEVSPHSAKAVAVEGQPETKTRAEKKQLRLETKQARIAERRAKRSEESFAKGDKATYRGKEYEVMIVPEKGTSIILRDPSTKTGGRMISDRSILKSVKTVADVPVLPKSEQVSVDVDPTVKETKVSAKTEKMNPRTGLTETQTEFLATRLRDAAYKGMQVEDIPHFVKEMGKEGFPYNANTKIEMPDFIEIPGDGKFRVGTVEAANRLHHKITGEPIPGLARAKDVTMPRTFDSEAMTKRPRFGRPSKERVAELEAENVEREAAEKRGVSADAVAIAEGQEVPLSRIFKLTQDEEQLAGHDGFTLNGWTAWMTPHGEAVITEHPRYVKEEDVVQHFRALLKAENAEAGDTTARKIASPEEVEALSTLAKSEDLTDVIGNVESEAKGNVLHLNTAEASETARTLLSFMRGSERKAEPLLKGLFLDPKQVAQFKESAEGFIEGAKELGIDAKPLETLVKNLDKAAEKNGTVRLQAYEDAEGHETGHEASYLGAQEKELSKRYHLENLASHKLFQKAFKGLAKLEGSDIKIKTAPESTMGRVAEESLMYIADGEAHRLGLTEHEGDQLAVELGLRYAQARMNENPDLNVRQALSTFDATIVSKYIDKAEQYETNRESKQGNEGDVAGEGAGREEHIRSDTSNEADDAESVSAKPIIGKGVLGTSKIGKSIETKAIEQGLTTETFPETAGYEKKFVQDQKDRISRLIEADFESARQMVLGQKEIPPSISPVMLLRGLEEVAKAKKDLQLQYELANSDVVSETSRHAQEMRMMREREQDSATTKINELRKARNEQVQKILKGRTIEQAIKEEAAKLNTTVKNGKKVLKQRQSWTDFVDSIAC